ncbi:MAG: RNA polymerase subunit sigma-70, partial [Pseudomonadota bacterium]
FDHQDTTLWDTSLVDEAEGLLKSAAQLFQTGRFQLEAAIQSAHMARRLKGQNTRSAVITLYRRLLDTAPSIGAQIGLAAALTANGQPSDALDELRKIETRKAERHQPFWATKAEADTSLGNTADALTSFDRAIALSTNEGVKQFLQGKRQRAAASD